MMLDLDEFEAQKAALMDHKGKGTSLDQVNDTFKILDLMHALEFACDQLAVACKCKDMLYEMRCQPCKSLTLLFGDAEPPKPKIEIVK